MADGSTYDITISVPVFLFHVVENKSDGSTRLFTSSDGGFTTKYPGANKSLVEDLEKLAGEIPGMINQRIKDGGADPQPKG